MELDGRGRGRTPEAGGGVILGGRLRVRRRGAGRTAALVDGASGAGPTRDGGGAAGYVQIGAGLAPSPAYRVLAGAP
jgi:hypothetical protein